MALEANLLCIISLCSQVQMTATVSSPPEKAEIIAARADGVDPSGSKALSVLSFAHYMVGL